MRRSRPRISPVPALFALALFGPGCGDQQPPDEEKAGAAPGEKAPTPPPPASDAGVFRARSDAPPPPPPEDLQNFHLDSAGVEYHVPERSRGPKGKARSIELMLRSTPHGARAAVDGVPIGRTPALWRGEVDGQAHDFTFVKPGYSMARYRFIPTQSGVVHGTLNRLPVPQKRDAGVPAGK